VVRNGSHVSLDVPSDLRAALASLR
jgi:hypothetical protein